MYEHTTKELAEYLRTNIANINKYVRDGKIKGKYKTKVNSRTRFYISHKEYIEFCDFYTSSEKFAKNGFAYKKTPSIDEYDVEPDKYNSYVSLKIQRDKTILEGKYLSKRKIKELSIIFKVCIGTINDVIAKNKDTKFTKELKKMSNIFK
jgi:hypothetical protein